MTNQFEFDSRNLAYVEGLLAEYRRDRSRLPADWRQYFDRLQQEHDGAALLPARPSFRPASIFDPDGLRDGTADRVTRQAERLRERVDGLVRSYRVRGHLVARLDPLGFERAPRPELDPSFHGLSEEDLDRQVSTASIGGPEHQTLRELIARLENTYCRYIGAQFAHIDDLEIRDWLQERMESCENRCDLSRDDQLRILTRLTDAVVFEEFVRKKYVAAKTFSLEGGESLIPLLDLAIEKCARQGLREIVIGMAHRGRLNVLANIIGKSLHEIFWEFEDPDPDRHRGSGDVKHHLGFSGDWQAQCGRTVHLSLCFNPSHLEFVDPVAVGRMRSKQDRIGDQQRKLGMALLIHGDAGFAGEGIVQETLNLSQLPGYTTGGTLHVIVNNQLGFTTPPEQGRSTVYAADVARMLDVPIFHVNGEHPEAVAQVVELALDFRHRFGRDVVIDMYCYRRWGHNEADEPSFTQPLVYNAIEHRPSVRDGYLKHLLELGGITRDEAESIAEARHKSMREAFKHVKEEESYSPKPSWLAGVWDGYQGGPEPEDEEPSTGVDADTLKSLLGRLTDLPHGFHLHRKLKRGFEARRLMAEGEQPLDFSAAEALALASLAVAGHRVRLSGQDSERGTFSQRHAVLHDVVSGERYETFQHLADEQAPVEIINSPLSEAGVLGFEYGFSLDYPDALVAWEAQFGDFCNAAQVIIDQFLASAEDKWRRLSGLVLLLPHGFEGQGPEHSSARLERFLALAAQHNLQIVWPTTPAQYFHCLRRQVIRPWRKPLVVLTPKSLLRHPRVVSSLDELASGRFQRVLGDDQVDPAGVSRVLLCSGKLYYDLLAAREKAEREDLALVRVEQLYPLPDAAIDSALNEFADETPVVWVQEEPQNMGALAHWKVRFGDRLLDRFPLSYISRPPSASPATGSAAAHHKQQRELIERALG